MKILLLAPHPFFQERGTPIDVLLVLRVLSERENTDVDLLVYNEGTEVNLPHLQIHRTPDLKFTQNVRPGFSLKKLICDFFMFNRAWSLVRKNKYDLIHAGEEAVFFAMFFKFLYKIPYVYDLDSSIAQQMVEKNQIFKPLASLFNWMEGKAIKGAIANLPVCNALADLCKKNGSKKTVTIHDISQLKNPDAPKNGTLKKEISNGKNIMLYIGNLEPYQGIDLLLESFQLASKKTNNTDLVIIGGVKEDIQFYQEKSKNLGIENRTHFLGPKPFDKLDQYLAEADILACPRIRGVNTPMKIFPYLHSGKPVLATDLYTHNQLLTKKEAYLAAADPEGFSEGMVALSEDKNLRKKIGQSGREFVEKNHTYPAHQKRLNGVYDWIEDQIGIK
jgi:glycosyltransferase involved in cell wall biosynthesis